MPDAEVTDEVEGPNKNNTEREVIPQGMHRMLGGGRQEGFREEVICKLRPKGQVGVNQIKGSG